jgi:hypothetical protein
MSAQPINKAAINGIISAAAESSLPGIHSLSAIVARMLTTGGKMKAASR